MTTRTPHRHAGRALYLFSKYTGPGETKGQNIEAFGAEWYLVATHWS